MWQFVHQRAQILHSTMTSRHWTKHSIKPFEEEKIQNETKSIFTGNHTDLVLQEFFLNQTSPRALLQGVANVINSGLIDNSANVKKLRQYCQMLSAVLRLDLTYILSKTLSLMEIQAMKNEESPFLFFNSSTSDERDKKRESLMAELSSHPVHLCDCHQTKICFICFIT